MIAKSAEVAGLMFEPGAEKSVETFVEMGILKPTEIKAYVPVVERIREVIKDFREGEPQDDDEEVIAELIRMSQVAIVTLSPEDQ